MIYYILIVQNNKKLQIIVIRIEFITSLTYLQSQILLQFIKIKTESFSEIVKNLKQSFIKTINKMTQEIEQKPKIQKPIYRSTKFFISALNTHLGHLLVKRLRNQSEHPENPNRIIGTLSQQKQKISNKYNFVPQGVRKIIETDKVQFFHDVILNSDVIIYDLNTSNLDQIQNAITALKIQKYSQNKTLICISNVMTWAKSKPKEKKQGQQQDGDQNPPEEPDSQQQGGQAADSQQKKNYVRFTQKDYNLRRPHPSYEKIKSIQTLCLAAGTAKPNLRTYVICSGITYGSGEQLLQPYFMQARLQKPQALTVYGKGKNRIPMVHICDLVTYIQKTIQKKPLIPYILAIDQNPKPTQKKIIESITKSIGTGKLVHNSVNNDIKDIDILTLNLRMKPCMYFSKLQEQQAAIQVEEGVQIQRFKFKWQTKEGIQKNIQKLRQEFNNELELKQQKVFIMGPPGCGKTHFAKKQTYNLSIYRLSLNYYLPHLHIKQVIEQVKSLQNQFGQQVRNAYNQKKQSEIAVKQQQYEAQKQKWKKLPKESRKLLQPFNQDKVDVRLPDQLIYKCYKWRLDQNDCLNRGYILDGYPRKYQDAKQLFMGFPPMPQGEQPDENTKKILDQRLAPTKFVLLQQSDHQILSNLQKLPEQVINATHFTEKQAKRRLLAYRKLMNSQTGDQILSDFFTENKIQTHLVNVTSQSQSLLESIIGSLPIKQSNEKDKINDIVNHQSISKQKLREQMTKKQQIIKNIQAQDYRMKKQNQQNQQRQILDKKSLALRKYLDVNLVPILSQGILQILREFPKDPVDKLAQFLFKNSLKVPNPDPSTFQF